MPHRPRCCDQRLPHSAPGLGAVQPHQWQDRRCSCWLSTNPKVSALHNSDLSDILVYANCFKICGVRRIEADSDWSFCHCLLWFRAPHIFWNNLCTLRCRSNLSCALSVQSKADCWTTLEEERLSVRREAAELVVRGVSVPEEITSCSTGTSSSLTDSMAPGTFHASFVTLSYSQGLLKC